MRCRSLGHRLGHLQHRHLPNDSRRMSQHTNQNDSSSPVISCFDQNSPIHPIDHDGCPTASPIACPIACPNESTSHQTGTPRETVGILDLRRQLCDQNVFVFHLPADWNETDLQRAFGSYGEILSCKVARRPDGTTKGYGFVCFDSPSAAFQAVEGMNGRACGGKRLKVSLKKTPEECLHLQVKHLMEISSGNQSYDRKRDCTLFVFHVPPTWEDKDIAQHFQSFGNLVTAKVMTKENNASRGYGFVTYDNPRSAALAIANMNGVEVAHNRRLKVQLKQQQQQSPSPSQSIPGDCTIFIFHLPNDWTDANLRKHFSHFGRILAATVQRDHFGNPRGYGFVSFDHPQSAAHAVIGMNGFAVGHKRLKVSLKRNGERESDDRLERNHLYTADSPWPFLSTPSSLAYWNAAAADFAVAVAAHAMARNTLVLPPNRYTGQAQVNSPGLLAPSLPPSLPSRPGFSGMGYTAPEWYPYTQNTSMVPVGSGAHLSFRQFKT